MSHKYTSRQTPTTNTQNTQTRRVQHQTNSRTRFCEQAARAYFLGKAPIQMKEKEPSEVQDNIHHTAQKGVRGSSVPLPFQARIQSSFGHHDISDVEAHTDTNAVEATKAMGAEAYATGNSVAFRGQPSLHTTAHEAAHIVQQRAGVQLQGGIGQVGDPYEQHADAVADAVVQGKNAQGLLDSFTNKTRGVQKKAVQRQEAPKAQNQTEKEEPQNKNDAQMSDDLMKKLYAVQKRLQAKGFKVQIQPGNTPETTQVTLTTPAGATRTYTAKKLLASSSTIERDADSARKPTDDKTTTPKEDTHECSLEDTETTDTPSP